MHDITKPLQLAIGSHAAGTGFGCAMNVISWENGDKEITDFPKCSDPVLAQAVQQVNDCMCEHVTVIDGSEIADPVSLLCPECSMKVLGLGHRTVGTYLGEDGTKVHFKILADAAQRWAGQEEQVMRDEKIAQERIDETLLYWSDFIRFCELMMTLTTRQRYNAWRRYTDCNTHRLTPTFFDKPGPARAEHLVLAESLHSRAFRQDRGMVAHLDRYHAICAAISLCSAEVYADLDSYREFLTDVYRLTPYENDGGYAVATFMIDRFDAETGWTAPVVPDEVVAQAYEQLLVKT